MIRFTNSTPKAISLIKRDDMVYISPAEPRREIHDERWLAREPEGRDDRYGEKRVGVGDRKSRDDEPRRDELERARAGLGSWAQGRVNPGQGYGGQGKAERKGALGEDRFGQRFEVNMMVPVVEGRVDEGLQGRRRPEDAVEEEDES